MPVYKHLITDLEQEMDEDTAALFKDGKGKPVFKKVKDVGPLEELERERVEYALQLQKVDAEALSEADKKTAAGDGPAEKKGK